MFEVEYDGDDGTMTTDRNGASSSLDDAKSGPVLWQLLYWAELFSRAASFVE